MAGYSGTPLIKKLGLKAKMKVSFVSPPSDYSKWLGKLPDGVAPAGKRDAVDFIHAFLTSRSELRKRFPSWKKRLDRNGLMWISWPKRTSAIETDLDGSLVREIGLENGLVDVKVCAVDEDWSGLKFVYRLEDRGKR